MPGKLIISLDFELMWGVRDHLSAATYGDAVLGGRRAIPRMLNLFEQYGIHATWATVGLLFAASRREMQDYLPTVLPQYTNRSLGNCDAVWNDVGDNEQVDPLHFGRSLLDQIASTDGQEIASHTFAHYYCLEDGQTLEAFAADIDASLAIARSVGHELRSIVFPRNQYSDAHIKSCADRGIVAFRGQPTGFAYRPMAKREETMFVRGARLVDSVVPVLPRSDPTETIFQAGAINVPASRFLRPWCSDWPTFSKLHVIRICAEMTQAAREDRQYHLWWHPHNFGRNMEQNLAQLVKILDAFAQLRDDFGMKSCSMAGAIPATRYVQNLS
jgi:peptidoglycan/xylan/chitin deacetylase (PgdA/CDA1 family)